MKVEMSFQERLMMEVFVGEQIYISGALETITNIQFEPRTRQVIFETNSGKSFTAFKDDLFEWEMPGPRNRITPQDGRIKGKLEPE